MPHEIEIVELNEIDGGVEVFARAWREDGTQIGFGTDGTVDIERFRIINPPILVDDENGDIVQEWTDRFDVVHTRRLREDPQEALIQSLTHTISIMKNVHGEENIVQGKRGNTTSTFYPDANTETTSVDGQLRRTVESATWSTIRGRTTATAVDDSGASREHAGTYAAGTNLWNELYRSMYLFDTSALPDGDTIDSAVLSVYFTAKGDIAGALDLALVSSNPASNTALSTSDFDIATKFGSTRLASDKSIASVSTSAYNGWTLNASGLANISKTGVSKFGLLLAEDLDNTAPTWSGGAYGYVTGYYADQTGTSTDPKLVVEHSAPAATFIPRVSFIM